MRRMTPELASLLASLRPRANSLIVTVFGDAIMPRGGTIWLGDLVQLMALFEVSERQVRTGVYRLSQEGWLGSETAGRRARYSLSDEGFARFAEAGQRIYAHGAAETPAGWTLVQGLSTLRQTERQSLRKTLKWLGFGQLSTSLMALPAPAPPGLMPELNKAGLGDSVLVFTAQIAPGNSAGSLLAAAGLAWPLEGLNADYETFISRFGALEQSPEKYAGEDAFVLRILLIHEYRRILLKDPHLPGDFLPADWAGPAAQNLSAAIYRQIVAPSETWLAGAVAEPAASAPPAGSDFWQRFGSVQLSAARS